MGVIVSGRGWQTDAFICSASLTRSKSWDACDGDGAVSWLMSASMEGLRRRGWRWGFSAFASFFWGAIASVLAALTMRNDLVRTITFVENGASCRSRQQRKPSRRKM